MNLCKTCELTARRDAGTAPLWDSIHRTQFWDIVHSYNSELPGWIVLVARRHIQAVDELTESEAIELGVLIRRVSIALKQVTGCIKTYVMQFAEAPDHPHVHFFFFFRMVDMPADRRGPRVCEYITAQEDKHVSEQAMNAMATQLQQILQARQNEKVAAPNPT